MIDLTGNQQVLQELFTSSAEGILVVDASGVIVLANPRCEELFGYPVSELMGKQLEVLVPDGNKHAHARFRKYFFEQLIFVETLSSGVDITEKRATEKAVMPALLEGQEAERQRIAKELHDGLGQALTAIRMNLNSLEADCNRQHIDLQFIINIYWVGWHSDSSERRSDDSCC